MFATDKAVGLRAAVTTAIATYPDTDADDDKTNRRNTIGVNERVKFEQIIKWLSLRSHRTAQTRHSSDDAKKKAKQ